MRRKPRPILPVPSWDFGREELDFDEGPEFFKDVHYPDFEELPGESSVAFRLRFAFASAGYTPIKIEEMRTHPIAIIKAIGPGTGRIADERLFRRQVRKILRQAGFQPKGEELTAGQTGYRILVAFMTGKWEPNFEEILREPHEDFADDANVEL